MSLIDLFDTGEVYDARPASPPPTFVNLQTAPTERIRLDARPTDRLAFAVLGSSGEFPLGIRPPAPELVDPAQTQRIAVPVTYGSRIEPEAEPRPWFYRGAHRWTRSRALLTAATWPGGVR